MMEFTDKLGEKKENISVQWLGTKSGPGKFSLE